MFYFDNFYGKKILKSSLLSDYDCFFTTREFVLTHSARTDLETIALQNREFLKNKLDVSKLYTVEQTHSANVQILDKNCFHYKDTDSLISTVSNSLFLLNFADCVPIILYSKTDNVGAIVHAGWRGTAKKIVSKTVDKMYYELNVKPQNITALIGPSIGKCCFETNEDVFLQLVENINDKSVYSKVKNKYFVDLKLLNKRQLLDSGVSEIDICDYCTCCMSDIFFSYRKEQGITARHCAVLKIKRG